MKKPDAWRRSSAYAATLGLRMIDSGGGAATVGLPVAEAVANRKGDVHGGAIASLIDVSMSEAIRSSIIDFKGLATVSLNVNFLAAGTGDLTASAVTMRCGKSTAFASAQVHDAESRLVATGQGAFRIIR